MNIGFLIYVDDEADYVIPPEFHDLRFAKGTRRPDLRQRKDKIASFWSWLDQARLQKGYELAVGRR